MKITVVTLFPKMLSGFFEESIIKRAREKNLVEIEIVNIRDFAVDSYGSVDDRPYGGGAGMVMRVDVLHKAIESAKNTKSKIVLTSPKGSVFDQKKAIEYSGEKHLIIVAGHYEGVDERIMDFIDEEVSLGDFVMTGGEIAAAAIVDSVVRLLPNVLAKKEATINESFNMKGKKILEHPQYTRPENYLGKKVPEVLLHGDHRKIEKWKIKESLDMTSRKRPDLIYEKKD